VVVYPSLFIIILPYPQSYCSRGNLLGGGRKNNYSNLKIKSINKIPFPSLSLSTSITKKSDKKREKAKGKYKLLSSGPLLPLEVLFESWTIEITTSKNKQKKFQYQKIIV